MPTHDCATCKVSGHCSIESIAPWLNEHEEELTQAVNNSAREITESPAPVIGFVLGYHKGRTHQDIPQAFKNM